MKIRLETTYNHKPFFDGKENEFYNIEIFPLIKISSFKSFYKLKSLIETKFFDEIIKSSNGKQIFPFETFKSIQDDLTLMFCQDEDRIFVISAGESQPGRYKIFLEGVWKFDGTQN
jgi:hypothetical protein